MNLPYAKRLQTEAQATILKVDKAFRSVRSAAAESAARLECLKASQASAMNNAVDNVVDAAHRGDLESLHLLTPSDLLTALRDAEFADKANQHALEKLQGELNATRTESLAADAGVLQEANKIVLLEAESLADEVLRDELALNAKRARLSAALELNAFVPSEKVCEALGKVIDDIDIPLNQLRNDPVLDTPMHQLAQLGTQGPLRNVSAEARQYWQSRIADLLSDGEPVAQDAAAA